MSHLCAVMFLVLLMGAGQAFAHAQLMASNPADGAVLSVPPSGLTLTFSEPVSGLVFRLTSPGGAIADLRPGAAPSLDDAEGTQISVPLPATMGPGTYSLSFRVVSQDGHPIGGGVLFAIGQVSAGAAPARPADAGDLATRIGLWSFRLLAMAGLVLGVGGTGWLVLLEGRGFGASPQASAQGGRRPWAGRSISGVLLAGLSATPFWIAFQGLDALGEGAGALLSPAVWRAGLSATSYGLAAVIGAAAMALARVALRLNPGPVRWVSVAFAVLLAGLVSVLAGHAATAQPRAATIPAILLHVLGAIVWIGCFLPLLGALGPRYASGGTAIPADDDGLRALRRVSRVLPAIFAVLAGTGLLLAVIQAQTLENLWRTDYGRVLLAKLAFVLALLALAAANRFCLTRPVLAGDAGARRLLRRSLLAELVLGTVVLAILGLWRFTPPPRVLISAVPPVVEHMVQAEGLTGTLSIVPARAGPVSVMLRDLESDGQTVEPLSVTIALSAPASGLGPFSRDAQKHSDGAYRADGFVLPVAGTWVARITVLVDDFHQVELTDRLEIAPVVPLTTP